MNIQEQEHWDFEAGAASEAQNCLTESIMHANDLSSMVKEQGKGPFVVTVSYPYYCKSTDAFACMVVCQIRRFMTSDLALAFVNEVQDGENDVSLSGHNIT